MTAIAPLTTDRLRLDPLTLDDADELYQFFSDTRVTRFMPFPTHTDVEETRQAVAGNLSRDGAYYWCVRLKDQDTVIGQINYLGGTRIPGLGYVLHPDYWGQGITVEACRAALDFGFDALQLDRVELWIDETNAASLRVAQKLGFKSVGRLALKYPHRPTNHFMLVCGMLASEWNGADPTSVDSPVAFFGIEPVLHVRDVATSAAFYRDQLGFHLDFLFGDPPTHGSVSRGQWSGSLVVIQLMQVPLNRKIVPSANLHIRVDVQIDTLYTQLQANDVTIIAEPQDKPWGFREFAIKDPDGHVLIFASYL